MVTGIIVLVSLVLLIVAHEFGHFIVAKLQKLYVPEFGIGFPPKLFGIKRGETEYSVNALPFGGFVRIAGEDADEGDKEAVQVSPRRLLFNQPWWKQSLVVLAGIIINFVLGWILFSAVFMIGTPEVVVISQVQEGSPAAAAGFQPGDLLQGYTQPGDFIAASREHYGKAMEIQVMRSGETLTLSPVLRSQAEAEQLGAVGVTLAGGGIPRQNPIEAVWSGAQTTWSVIAETIQGFGLLISRLVQGSVPRDVVGPVGIFSIAHQAGEIGSVYLLQILAIISVNLAVLNLIPFPALDGGRFVMIIFEKLRGKALSKQVQASINGVGMVLLLLLMLIVTVRDVLKIW